MKKILMFVLMTTGLSAYSFDNNHEVTLKLEDIRYSCICTPVVDSYNCSNDSGYRVEIDHYNGGEYTTLAVRTYENGTCNSAEERIFDAAQIAGKSIKVINGVDYELVYDAEEAVCLEE